MPSDVSKKPQTDVEKMAEENEADGLEKTGEEYDKRSLNEYVKKILSSSLVTGVSNIVATKSTIRKVFKVSVLLLCTCGFLYQATEFVLLVLTYPSVVDIQVYTPKKFNSPAYTFCNNNGVKRSKFCAKYPDDCEKPSDIKEFCKMYSRFCQAFDDVNEIVVPKRENYSFETFVSFEELKELGHSFDDILKDLTPEADDHEISEPILIRKPDLSHILCYTLFLRVNSTLDPHRINSEFVWRKVQTFIFDVEPSENFLPYRRPGGFFNLHSPFILENPFENSIFLKPHHTYMVHMRMEEEDLLPQPYESNCRNYTETWLKSDRTGPRSQEACNNLCLMEALVGRCGCTIPEILHVHGGPYCNLVDFADCIQKSQDHVEESYYKCSGDCKDDCQKFKYFHTYQTRLMESDPMEDATNPNFNRAEVNIISADPEVKRFSYRPQYQDIEVFSYLGGFIGAWMGVSLVAIIDLFESGGMIMAFIFKRRRQWKPVRNGRPNVNNQSPSV